MSFSAKGEIRKKVEGDAGENIKKTLSMSRQALKYFLENESLVQTGV